MLQTRTVVKLSAGEGHLGMQSRALGRPGPGEALLRIRRAAICGTDLHIYHWNAWAARNYTLPLVLGHEFCAEIEELGPEAGDWRTGQRVSGETHIFCGTCEQCRSNRRHTCENLRLFSKSGFGCFSDYSIVPLNALRAVPDGMPAERAAILEPLGVGVRAAMEAEVSGKSVLVLGCGPIGLYAIAAARALGAASIAAADLSAPRVAMATRVGADRPVPAATLPDNAFHVVIDATGSTSAIEGALVAIRPGGMMILVGLPDRPISIPPHHLINREITVRGIYGRLIDETWIAAMRLLESGRLALDGIETAEFPLADFDAAFHRADSGTTGKVIFNLDA